MLLETSVRQEKSAAANTSKTKLCAVRKTFFFLPPLVSLFFLPLLRLLLLLTRQPELLSEFVVVGATAGGERDVSEEVPSGHQSLLASYALAILERRRLLHLEQGRWRLLIVHFLPKNKMDHDIMDCTKRYLRYRSYSLCKRYYHQSLKLQLTGSTDTSGSSKFTFTVFHLVRTPMTSKKASFCMTQLTPPASVSISVQLHRTPDCACPLLA